ncbi:MAG: endolytic transglycosylase MltG, partial [Rickettsiales bacterium]|nr:endolytic transglycosylase MltG [Rickettsiales bacterium]
MKRKTKKFLKKAWWRVLLIFVTLVFILFFMHSSGTQEKVVFIEKGANLSSIAQTLKKEKVIYSKKLFKFLSYITNSQNKLKAGEYLFTPRMSLWKVNKTLVE